MSTWIFQGNPEIFDIDGYLNASAGLISWRVTAYAERIALGDNVYLWKSQGKEAPSAGIVAEGTVVDLPKVQKSDALSIRFWKQKPDDEEWLQVKIRINRIASKKEVLKREWMKDDSVLSHLLIMRQPAGTNFPVQANEAKRLSELWRKTGSDWTRDEIVAALWLYDRLFGKPISKSQGSEVELVAQKIGRATTGVYNKLMNFRAFDPRAAQAGLSGGSDLDEVIWNEFFNTAKNHLESGLLNLENERLWGSGNESDRSPNATITVEETRLAEKNLNELLTQYANRPKNKQPMRKSQVSFVYDRDPIVVAIRKKLADYLCEVDGCQSNRFQTEDGDYFVEIHHLLPLAAGGPDILENTVALCPTHHRLIHLGKDREKLTNELRGKRELDGEIVVLQ